MSVCIEIVNILNNVIFVTFRSDVNISLFITCLTTLSPKEALMKKKKKIVGTGR